MTGKVSFVSACRTHFGMKPGQTLSQFAAEVKTVSGDPETRAYFVREFAKVGIEIEEGH